MKYHTRELVKIFRYNYHPSWTLHMSQYTLNNVRLHLSCVCGRKCFHVSREDLGPLIKKVLRQEGLLPFLMKVIEDDSKGVVYKYK